MAGGQTVTDALFRYLRAAGYSGHLQKMKSDWLDDQYAMGPVYSVGVPYFMPGAARLASSSAYAAKGNVEIALKSFRMDKVNFYPHGAGGTSGEVVVALVDGSDVITSILTREAYTNMSLSAWNELTLSSPPEIAEGQRFLTVLVRSTALTNGIAYTTVGTHDSTLGDFQGGWRRNDTDLQVGDGNAAPNAEPWVMDYQATSVV